MTVLFSLLILSATAGRLREDWLGDLPDSSYVLRSRRTVAGTGDAGLLPGETIVFRKQNGQETQEMLFHWYAQDVYLTEVKEARYLVAFSSSKISSPNDTCLAFFKGTNLLQAYKASAFVSPTASFFYNYPPLTRCVEFRADDDATFYVEKKDGHVLTFDITTGRLVREELKYRSLMFTKPFENLSSRFGSREYRIVAGEIAAVDPGKGIAYLVRVNELKSQKGLAQFIVTDVPKPENIHSGEPWWFVARGEETETGSFVAGHLLGMGIWKDAAE